MVQSDDLPLSTGLVAPTSTGRRPAPFHPEIEVNGIKTRVMAEHLTVVDPQMRLEDFVGRLDSSELQSLDVALQVVLDLD